MKKQIFAIAAMTIAVTAALYSCKKDEVVSKSATESKGGTYVKRQGEPGYPMRKYVNGENNCRDESENCAPYDYAVEDHDWIWGWESIDDNGVSHGFWQIGTWTVEWICPAGETKPPLRTSDFNNVLVSNFAKLGIENQTQLDRLDNETFYKTLFPGLSHEHLRMLYSDEYKTALVLRKGSDKKFLFVVPKETSSLEDAYNHPELVIPIISTK